VRVISVCLSLFGYGLIRKRVKISAPALPETPMRAGRNQGKVQGFLTAIGLLGQSQKALSS
jgi:hypothetical protein